MIKIIESALGEVAGDYHNIDISFKAEDVLNAVEKAGVLPPGRQPMRSEYKHLSDEWYFELCDGIEENTWEKEE